MSRTLVTSAHAAAEVGVHPNTLRLWVQVGRVHPTFVTPGGHARWNVDDLKRQLQPQEASPVEPVTHPEHQPVAAAVVTSPLGVLAGKRNDGKPPWTFIAGEVEPGESARDAAVREVKEETGLEVYTDDMEIGRRVHPKTGRTMIYLAAHPVKHADPVGIFVGDTDELAAVEWLTLDQAEERLAGMYLPVQQYLRATLS